MLEYIGIDLGGTNIRVGGMDENENIIFEYKEPTFIGVENADDLCDKITELIKKVPSYETAKAIGLGVPGSVDEKTGRIITAKNVGMLVDYPLLEKISQEFNKNVFIDNDAKVAALAEAIGGRGKDKNTVCYVTISTGLGGGVVIDKKIYHGSNCLGGYFARVIVDGINPADSVMSGRALCEQARNNIDNNINSTVELFDFYNKGNAEASVIVNSFKQNLLALLLTISATINPDIIVFGGGVMQSKEYFFEDVKNTFKEKAHPLAKNTIIELAQYDEPGIMGACFLAKYDNK